METKARSSHVSASQIQRPNSMEWQELPHQERERLKKLFHKKRFGTLNVWCMPGRGRVIANPMRKKEVFCVQ